MSSVDEQLAQLSSGNDFLRFVQTDVAANDARFVKNMARLATLFSNCKPELIKDWSCQMCTADTKPEKRLIFNGTIKKHDQFAVAVYPRGVVVVFRGTANSANAGSDINVKPTPMPSSWGCKDGEVHGGFYAVYETLRAALFSALADVCSDFQRAGQTSPVPVLLIGHSLGGACSSIAALDLKLNLDKVRVLGNITYESPRVWTKAAVACYTVQTVRVTNSKDPIVHLPPRGLFHYRHLGDELFLKNGKATWCSQSDVAACEAGTAPCRCSSQERFGHRWLTNHCLTAHFLGFNFCDCGQGYLSRLQVAVTVLAVLGAASAAIVVLWLGHKALQYVPKGGAPSPVPELTAPRPLGTAAEASPEASITAESLPPLPPLPPIT